MHVQPYLHFYGRCEEAIEFYRTALGADSVELLRFEDCPDPLPPGAIPPGYERKVMHGTFRVGDVTVMASDGNPSNAPAGYQGFSLAITSPADANTKRLFAALSDGGEVRMPPGKTFWSPCFGVVTDRFGITWMLNTAPPQG